MTGTCDYCGLVGEVTRPASMTAYVTDLPDDDPKNPNNPGLLCAACAELYRDYWQDMWDEYRGSQGI